MPVSLESKLRASAGGSQAGSKRRNASSRPCTIPAIPDELEQSECCNVDINDLVVDLNPMLTRLVGPEITIHHELQSDLSPVWGDARLLEQVAINLVVSARAAMPDGGTLSISTEATENILDAHRTPKGVRLTISDSGNGISVHASSLLSASDPDLSNKPISTSLMAANKIVQLHNGVISINSEVGHGTDVGVELPFTAKPLHSLERHRAKQTLNAQTILVVEDVHSVGSRLYNILDKAGYQVLTTHDGQSAIDMLTAKNNKIDLCLFDVAATKVDGNQAYELIQQKNLTVPTIVMVSAKEHCNESVSENERIQQVRKPFSRANILTRIKSCLAS